MEEELKAVLSNEALDNEEKVAEIKKYVGENFVSQDRYKTVKANEAKAVSDLETVNAEFEAFKQSKMTEEEKKIAYVQGLEATVKNYKMDISKSKASEVFANAGVDQSEYSEIVNRIASEDANSTVELATMICKTLTANKQKTEKSITEQIIKQTPKPEGGVDKSASENTIDSLKAKYEEAVKHNDYVTMATCTRQIQELQNKK